MGLDGANFDKRSLSSLHRQHSNQNLRMHPLTRKPQSPTDTDPAISSSARNSAGLHPEFPNNESTSAM